MDPFSLQGDHTARSANLENLGSWHPASNAPPQKAANLRDALRYVRQPLYLVEKERTMVPRLGGIGRLGAVNPGALPIAAYAPPCFPENLGDPSFCRELGIRYPYVGGSMAKGISSAAMAEELGRAGMLGFFGAAGLPLATVSETADRLKASLGDIPYGFNLIHSPHEPELERELAELYIKKGIRTIEASAFLALTLPLVRYRLHGIKRAADGSIVTPNRIIAKVSREELAAKFFAPAPEKLLRALVANGSITAEQAELAALVPLAQDVTAEADSGGHTDNRPALALFPTINALAAKLQRQYGYSCRLRVGLGGGVSTPASAAAAFSMGAAYLVTGSVNQACVESGTSDTVRGMLAGTRQADVTMAPAADMFEMGVTVQVLKRGTMFPMRAQKLYEIYRACSSLDDIPAAEREKLEKTMFQASLADIWHDTRAFFAKRDPSQVERAERDPKHLMALVFRWYLGMAAHWAKDGAEERRMDYQVWCGPAMGAFNEWASGSFLDAPGNRTVEAVALNILHGAAALNRANFLSSQGIELRMDEIAPQPLEIAQIKEYLC
ncbi:flavin oxidoreductase, PfaD family, putative [Citrifermentans bemidjiense Bem]|uniref:Flavin oxidoreductase, PfaD family, putative n=1 Tax=Citrifermentans bemidjiense (strain ATCC BAA-1014 / DSM 16622 / JCM 12645 / Bem) TaxID=404380 RepID=B5ECT4_CITBB|nr:PfaD family polyunsaturated fatty acid/polyketide biosynthesis protein [Citrifermentans bemidjiense]ACH39119.1 flavin oxidoreductase, PfaD family, putative [Citrifermentans bemidjiense Bem]